MTRQQKWDNRFYDLCEEIGNWSSCLSRKIGSVLVRDNTILATGYNGPPRGVSHCGGEREKKDVNLFRLLKDAPKLLFGDSNMCPRQRLGYKSGEGLHLCPAAHAEDNCITNAAREGVITIGATLYLNACIPCKDCLKKIINAGIDEIVCTELTQYDELSKWLIGESNLIIRTFEEGEE